MNAAICAFQNFTRARDPNDKSGRRVKQRGYSEDYGDPAQTLAWQKPHKCVSCTTDWTDAWYQRQCQRWREEWHDSYRPV